MAHGPKQSLLANKCQLAHAWTEARDTCVMSGEVVPSRAFSTYMYVTVYLFFILWQSA